MNFRSFSRLEMKQSCLSRNTRSSTTGSMSLMWLHTSRNLPSAGICSVPLVWTRVLRTGMAASASRLTIQRKNLSSVSWTFSKSTQAQIMTSVTKISTAWRIKAPRKASGATQSSPERMPATTATSREIRLIPVKSIKETSWFFNVSKQSVI